ncbi:MAG: hypothetical protein IKG69_10160 [Atopobiaceae bacterium]|nr:hypothetical protein [Atopobiaceae bacterium]
MSFMNDFAEKHPKAAQWIREGGLFLIFSYVVTFLKWALLTFLPAFFQGMVGAAEWGWPAIGVEIAGVPLVLNVIGNSAADGGLAFTLANFTAIILGEVINFPLQRNITFRSHGPVFPQILCHFAGALAVFFVMNLFTCVWNPVTAAFGVPDAIRNIVTTVVTGGVAMVIIFAIDKTIFSPKFMNPNYVPEETEEAQA